MIEVTTNIKNEALIKTLKTINLKFIFLSLLVLFSGCKSSEDFYEKTNLSEIANKPEGENPIGNAPPAQPPGTILPEPPIDPVPAPPAAPPVPPVIVDPICKTNPKACDLNPVVSKPGVVTMLVAFGDLVDDKVVISEGSARMIAQNAVKFASPVVQPKILVVKDHNNNGESKYDTEYIAKNLLANYKEVDIFIETPNGLKASDVEGYDLVWFNNPGHPMGSVNSKNVLMNFKGGVILSGDDLTRGKNFSLEELTGLKNIDNGESIACNNVKYNYDNNNVSGRRYQIKVSDNFFPDISPELKAFEYGNDIDGSAISTSISIKDKVQVLAHAYGAPGACADNKRPVIVRYEK